MTRDNSIAAQVLEQWGATVHPVETSTEEESDWLATLEGCRLLVEEKTKFDDPRILAARAAAFAEGRVRLRNFGKRRPSWKRISGRSKMPGIVTSGVEVTNISKHGFWVLVGEEELAVPFAQFPWFRKATIEQLADVQRPTENHLYWPQLDIDLSVESIRNPGAYPLMSAG